MSNVELLSFPDDRALAHAAAKQWLAEIDPALNPQTKYSVALSGGRIARTFFEAVTQFANSQANLLRKVHYFWGDERCVPPDEQESNFAVANELLLKPLIISPSQIHRIIGENPPEAAAAQAGAEMLHFIPSRIDDQPLIDLIFLGMGEDGHVASLFPMESEEVRANRAVYRPVVSPKPPPHRITIGYPAIAAARQVWVLASGPGKRQALQESLEPNGKTPLAHVLRLRNFTKILTDIRVNQ